MLDGTQKTDTNSNTDFTGHRKTDNTDTETNRLDRNTTATTDYKQDEKEKFGKNTAHIYDTQNAHEFGEENTQNYGKTETQTHNTTDKNTINTSTSYEGKEITKILYQRI